MLLTHVHYEAGLSEDRSGRVIAGDVAVELLAVTVPGVMLFVLYDKTCKRCLMMFGVESTILGGCIACMSVYDIIRTT